MVTLKLLGIMFLVIVGVIIAQTYSSYQHDIHAARERVMSGSHVIETACGPIEYASRGEGHPVLVIHGAGGGYDQGLFISEVLLSGDFRVRSIGFEITEPTMIVHARDDALVNPTHSQYAAQKIPDSKLITLESGGHILMGQHERVRTKIVKFLKEHAATVANGGKTSYERSKSLGVNDI